MEIINKNASIMYVHVKENLNELESIILDLLEYHYKYKKNECKDIANDIISRIFKTIVNSEMISDIKYVKFYKIDIIYVIKIINTIIKYSEKKLDFLDEFKKILSSLIIAYTKDKEKQQNINQEYQDFLLNVPDDKEEITNYDGNNIHKKIIFELIKQMIKETLELLMEYRILTLTIIPNKINNDLYNRTIKIFVNQICHNGIEFKINEINNIISYDKNNIYLLKNNDNVEKCIKILKNNANILMKISNKFI